MITQIPRLLSSAGHLQALAGFNVRMAEFRDDLFSKRSILPEESFLAKSRAGSLTSSGSSFQEGQSAMDTGSWSRNYKPRRRWCCFIYYRGFDVLRGQFAGKAFKK